MTGKVNLQEQFARFDDHWSPKIVASVNDYDLKLVKARGEFVFVVPRGVHHRPVAGEETHLVLLKPHETLNTGDAERAGTMGERLD